MSDDKVPVRAMVDPDKKERAMRRLDHGGMTREIRRLIDQLAATERSEKQRLKDELEEKRQGREDKKTKRSELDDEITQLDAQIRRLEERLDSIRDKEGEYDGYLQAIEGKMHDDGMHVFEDHGQIQRAAEIGECEPTDVIQDLQERNPSLPQSRFEKGGR